jgi:hypothetical protein
VTRTLSPLWKPVPATSNGFSYTTRSCGFRFGPPAASPLVSPAAAARIATQALTLRIASEDSAAPDGPVRRFRYATSLISCRSSSTR